MKIRKLFTMKCYFCGDMQSFDDVKTQRRAYVKFFDVGWRVRADEDVCPNCVSMLPLKVSRRELPEIKQRLLTQRVPEAGDSSQ